MKVSKYTIELDVILQSDVDLGMNLYPIFSEGYRTTLNNKIFDHYKFFEIGFETIGRFKHYLNMQMNEIMPYYNKLYQSELISINPLLTFQRVSDSNKDVDSTTVKEVENNAISTGDTSGTSTNAENQDTTLNSTKTTSATNSGKSKDVGSDTPQSLVIDSLIDADYFASNVKVLNSEGMNNENDVLLSTEGIGKTDNGVTTSRMDSETTTNEDGRETLSLNEKNVVTENGFEIPLSDLLIKYRETFINVDMLVIDELKDLFMQIY